MSNPAQPPRRKIHVDLPAELHRKLRIKAAIDGLSIQGLVTRLVAEAVERIKLPANQSKPQKEH